MQANALDAANDFPDGPDKDRYVAAAQTLRTPYWDWAKNPPSGQHVVPDSLTATQVTVNTPSGQQTIDNPLYNYKFHPTDPGLYYQPVSLFFPRAFQIRKPVNGQ